MKLGSAKGIRALADGDLRMLPPNWWRLSLAFTALVQRLEMQLEEATYLDQHLRQKSEGGCRGMTSSSVPTQLPSSSARMLRDSNSQKKSSSKTRTERKLPSSHHLSRKELFHRILLCNASFFFFLSFLCVKNNTDSRIFSE